MGTFLENLPIKKKKRLKQQLVINTFTINVPVNGQVINIVLCLFCNKSIDTGKKSNSYSVVGRIGGIKCDRMDAEIISDYGTGKILKDFLPVLYNQFIYSNQGTKTVILELKLNIKGTMTVCGQVEASVKVKLRYNLYRLMVSDVKSEYKLKNAQQVALMLMQ